MSPIEPIEAHMFKPFEVHYSFTCPNPFFLKPNDNRVEVMATDMAAARDQVIARVACLFCLRTLPAGHYFTTSVEELK